MQMTDPEILSPAGNPEKLYYAFHYGADAVYCALDRFGLRAQADNFTPEQLDEGVKYAHSIGKKLYVALNVMPHDSDFPALRDYIAVLRDISPDAYIVSDPGVLSLVRERIPDAEIHLSTQASTVNTAACNFWYGQGVKRIVVARELSLAEVKRIRAGIPEDMEIECFVHGAMCMSYSGRCLLSDYMTGRSANAGKCTQPCRWEYTVTESGGERSFDAVQDGNGSYLFSSRDMCMIRHIPELIDSGINSFKIEGRMKSAYYTAAITNAYRMAIDCFRAGRPLDDSIAAETESVSHREYGTGFWFSSPSEGANTVSEGGNIGERSFLCTVVGYDPVSGLALCSQRNKMRVGDTVQVLTPGQCGRDITVTELFDTDMQPIASTPHPRSEFYLRCDNLKKGDIIRGK